MCRLRLELEVGTWILERISEGFFSGAVNVRQRWPKNTAMQLRPVAELVYYFLCLMGVEQKKNDRVACENGGKVQCGEDGANPGLPNGREEIFTSKKIQFSSDVSKKDKKGLVYFFFIFEFKDKK